MIRYPKYIFKNDLGTAGLIYACTHYLIEDIYAVRVGISDLGSCSVFLLACIGTHLDFNMFQVINCYRALLMLGSYGVVMLTTRNAMTSNGGESIGRVWSI